MSDLEYIIHTMQAMSESEDATERLLAERITNLARSAEKARRRAQFAGTRMLRMARKYRAALKHIYDE